MFTVFVTLTYLGLVPVLLTVLVVSRDVVIIAGALTYQWLIEPVRGEPDAHQQAQHRSAAGVCDLHADGGGFPVAAVPGDRRVRRRSGLHQHHQRPELCRCVEQAGMAQEPRGVTAG